MTDEHMILHNQLETGDINLNCQQTSEGEVLQSCENPKKRKI